MQPVIAFYCPCGQKVYSVSTNVIALNHLFSCICGKEYRCENSIIAVEYELPTKPQHPICNADKTVSQPLGDDPPRLPESLSEPELTTRN
jgi:hypothetical protein